MEELHTPPDSTQRPVKPAFKKKNNNKQSSKTEKKNLKWDEVAIEEHDQLRGTRMKIDEPNTPYTHYDSGSETDNSASAAAKNKNNTTNGANPDNLCWDTLQNKLDTVAAVRDAYPSSPSSHGGHSEPELDHDAIDEKEKLRRKELKELEFKEHRKRHYNEMELVRKFRQEHPNDFDLNLNDDNDDNDADDEND